MKARILDEAALRAISPQALSAYARGEGWTPVEPFGEHSMVYAMPSSGVEIVIPGTAALGDYDAVVAELIARFALNEDRGELQLYRDLVSADRDVIRVRVPTAEDDGSVAVEPGVQLFSNSRDLVLSAACAAWSPQRSYRAGRVRQAEEYMNRVRLGQTEQGSFVVTLLAPVPPALEQVQAELWPSIPDEPYERRVTRRLATGLDAAATAIEGYNLKQNGDVFDGIVRDGVSANLCDAAAALSDRGDGFEVSVTWAKTRPAPVERWTRTFSRSEGEVLREVSRLFREKQPRPDEQLEGFIVKLAREGAADEDGAVVLKAYVDNTLVSVRAKLDPADYRTAIDAHESVHPIAMTGTLERRKQRWWLSNPTEVRKLAADDEPEGDASPVGNS